MIHIQFDFSIVSISLGHILDASIFLLGERNSQSANAELYKASSIVNLLM